MVLSDRPTSPVDAALFFGRSWFDAEKWGLYQLMVDLYKSGTVQYIVTYGLRGQRFGDITPNVVAPSNEYARDRLIKMGVPNENIITAPLIDPTKNNTLEEGRAFLKEARDHGWNSLVVVANPHQLLRATLGLLGVMDQQAEPSLSIWSAAPTNTDWTRRVRGAQGEHFGPRSDHIDLENGRIRTYQGKGDLASFPRYFDYLSNRGHAIVTP